MTDRVSAPGVIRQGRPALEDRSAFYQEVAGTFGEGQSIVVTVEEEAAAVSRQARGYYFGHVLKRLAVKTGHSIDDLHAWAKAKFTPKHLTILDGNGHVVDDLVIGSTTTKFDSSQFFEYVEELRGFMAVRLGIETDDPDPRWREKKTEAA